MALGAFFCCLQAALANPATSLALASAAAALREARQQASGLSSDDQASVFDKVMRCTCSANWSSANWSSANWSSCIINLTIPHTVHSVTQLHKHQVIHQQRRELEQLYNNILDYTPHRTQYCSTMQPPGDPPAAARTGAAPPGESRI